MSTTFGERFRYMRVARGMSQRDMAERINEQYRIGRSYEEEFAQVPPDVDMVHISKVENRHLPPPAPYAGAVYWALALYDEEDGGVDIAAYEELQKLAAAPFEPAPPIDASSLFIMQCRGRDDDLETWQAKLEHWNASASVAP